MNYLSLSKQGRTHVNIKSNFMQCIYQYARIQLDNWYITESTNLYGYIQPPNFGGYWVHTNLQIPCHNLSNCHCSTYVGTFSVYSRYYPFHFLITFLCTCLHVLFLPINCNLYFYNIYVVYIYSVFRVLGLDLCSKIPSPQ